MSAPRDVEGSSQSMPMASACEQLQDVWRDLNTRHFHGRLPHIEIVWSARLTASAAMFVSRAGPRAAAATVGAGSRAIRLSTPLLVSQPFEELVNTLAHEMIHQWQFDILKRRPNHGPDFRRKMTEMNRAGLQITIHHSLEEAVQRLTRYAWQCQQCGRAYERQRRTIRPAHHRCGACRGRLQEVSTSPSPPAAEARMSDEPASPLPRRSRRRTPPSVPPLSQLNLFQIR